MIIESRQHSNLVFPRIQAEALGFGLEICDQDFQRPWGGFLRFSEDSLGAFFEAYWKGVDTGKQLGRRDPKVLLVAPGQRLSLQLHHRRSELWRVIDGPVLVIHGPDELHLVSELLFSGDVIHLECGEIHRLCGSLTAWGRVAEIWEHVDTSDPSDESDIIRLQDDYSR
ncbi:MAG TPA: phosphoheptose isomerase [Armatimonadota bacterium]|jgi:mannose-6-phosphate isomerase-like protein (cupin superfamily)